MACLASQTDVAFRCCLLKEWTEWIGTKHLYQTFILHCKDKHDELFLPSSGLGIMRSYVIFEWRHGIQQSSAEVGLYESSTQTLGVTSQIWYAKGKEEFWSQCCLKQERHQQRRTEIVMKSGAYLSVKRNDQ
eukprot:4131208-Amphidinium_carterae.1